MKSASRCVLRCATAVLAGLASMVATAVDYGGIGPTTDPASLRELFPASRHEFWQRGTGSVVVAGDDPAKFEALLREGEGRYKVQLAADDTRAEATSVSMSLEGGKVRLVSLGFEREGQGDKPEQVERRHPGCRAVLDALLEKFGQQPVLTTRVEEYLEHRTRTWTSPEGVIRLDCGRYVNRRPIFAIDLEFDATPGAAAPAPARKPVAPAAAAPATVKAPVPVKPAAKPVAKPAEKPVAKPAAKTSPAPAPKR